jgi:hypothetical protein
MSRWELFLLHASTLAIAISGVVYGLMKYAMTGSDPDSPLGHPWQPGVLKAHVLAAPFLVFAFGLVARGHALPKWRSGEKTGRKSGIALLGLVAPLVLSGYAVQVFTGDSLRRATGWVHAALGAVWVLAYAVHLLKKRPANGALRA